MIEQIKQTAAYIRSQVQEIPTTAIILGTGLGALVDHIEDKNTFPTRRFPISLYQQLKGIAVISFWQTRQHSGYSHAGTVPLL